MNVPLLDLKAQYDTLRAEMEPVITRVIESQWFINGPEVVAVEEEIAAYSRSGYGVGVSSGTDALLVALMALDIGAGDEVITTPYSFFATAGVVARLGATPVFVDIDPATFNIDAARIEAAITDRTRAIIPVHLYGRMADMTGIMNATSSRGIPVIEDAAQSIGALDSEGRTAGSIGMMGCLSFFPSKNLGGFGDGGMVITNDEALAIELRMLRMHGMEPKYFHSMVGGNFRLDALQAAVLRVKLPHLDAWTAARRRNAGLYRALFADRNIAEIILPQDEPGHIYNQFVIRAERRDELQAHLRDNGIGTEIYYPVPLHRQECFEYLGYGEGSMPHSETAAAQTLALPIYPELSPDQIDWVVKQIAEFYQKNV